MSDIRIQDDLYAYVNGEWLSKAVIPDDRPTTGGFSELDQEVEKTLMADFKALANNEKQTTIDCIDDAIKLYQKVLDVNTRNALGIKPLISELHKIQAIKNIDDLNSCLKDFCLNGIVLPVNLGVSVDMQNTSTNSFYVLGPDIILPDTTYYDTDSGNKLLAIYEDMLKQLFEYTDLSAEEQALYIKDTLAFDYLVSKQVKSQVEWADYVKTYNPMEVDKVINYLKPLAFDKLLLELYQDKQPDKIIVLDPKAIEHMQSYFNKTNLHQYLHWAYAKTLVNNCKYLSEDLYSLARTYFRNLRGVKQDPELSKQAYQIASSFYSEPIGRYYGLTYFGEEAKQDITNLVYKVIDGYKERINKNTFLEETTKQKAILKLSTIKVKMGYPDKIGAFYQELKVANDDNYFEAIKKIIYKINRHELEELTKPVDRNKWLMPGHMVNACYDPSRNDITFPAAILQEPFYSIKQGISKNLGGIGAVIAHEISHAFDNNGSRFDEKGNLNNWWTGKDLANFKVVTQSMIEQWDGLEFAGGKVNGELVVSENIADNGGMAVTLQIMHTLQDANFADYFINWARVWCMKAKDEYKALLLKTDVHSPTELRANIQVRNFKEWYETFDVKASDKMFIPEDKRIIIW